MDLKNKDAEGGDPKEMAQLTDGNNPRCFYERINGGKKFGVPSSSVVTVSCKAHQKDAGWTPTGARAYFQFNDIDLEHTPGVNVSLLPHSQ